MNCPSQELLKEWFSYEDGQLFWKVSRGRVRAGSLAGTNSTNQDGKVYRKIRVNGSQFLAHRLIWTLLKGPIEDFKVIDHRNGDTTDNRIENLRVCSSTQNAQNIHKGRGRHSSYKGVSFSAKQGKFVAQIRVDGVSIWLGSFESEEEAYKAYCEASSKHFGEFANHG